MTTFDQAATRPITGLWYELVQKDAVPLQEEMRQPSHYTGTNDTIAVERYTSRDWHLLEREHLWRKVWQMACREEHLPYVGSYIVYDIAGDSYIVVRTHDGIKAYVNACLHRGRALKTYDGRCTEIRCPFHGFTWRLDGTLRYIPAREEFPQVESDRSQWRLPEAKVATWGGFVFINPDPDGVPLEEFLGVLPQHFARWDFDNRYVEAHVAKLLRCNWKVAQEAFDEGLHLAFTHPQSASYVGDGNSAVDFWGYVARQISPSGTPADVLPGDVEELDILRRMLDVREGEELPIPFTANTTARDSMARAARERWRPILGDAVDGFSDAEMVDHWNYIIFPNLHPWGAFNRIVYRFRPNGDRHDQCIFEVMLVTPFVGERPPPAAITWIGFDEPWTSAPELSTLALVMEQDSFNMEAVQRGLETIRKPHVTASHYQEDVLRWRHDLLTEWVAEGMSGKGS